jgi:hypothetical protein
MEAIFYILLVIGAIYLYYRLMKWMFTAIAPDLLVILSLVGTILVPVLYGRSIFRAFGMSPGKNTGADAKDKIFDKGWRNIIWLPVFVILFLIYCDFAYCLLVFFANIFPRIWSITLIIPFITKVVFGAWLNSLITQLLSEIEWLRSNSSYPAIILISAAIKGTFIAPMLVFIRGLYSAVEDGKQPAKVQYFFNQALKDLKNVIYWTTTDLFGIFALAFSSLRFKKWNEEFAFVGCGIMLFTWPLILTCLASLIPPFVVAVGMLAIMVSLHTLGVMMVWLLNSFFSIVLFCAERAVIFVRSGYAKCPHASCHEPVPLPIFICPNCGARHERLIPGRYGTFRRTCTCGNTLPTLFWLGKGKLASICPHCNKPLRSELFGGNVHIPIYGGGSSGKTMFMMASTWQMLEDQLEGIKANLINEVDEKQYQDIWKPDFENGRLREKTQELIPDAFLLSIRRKYGLPISLYMYDPAGEALVNETELQGHRFLRYFDGLVFVLDPLSLESMSKIYQEKQGNKVPETTSQADPYEIVNHIVNVLEQHAKLSRRKGFKRRIAIVMTKADIPIVQKELGLNLSDLTPIGKWAEIGREESEKLHLWFSRHEPALLQLIETRFSDIRFFITSSLGFSSNEQKPFRPKQVLNPLCWLLSKRQVLARPLLARIGVWMSESMAIAIILLMFLVGPVIGGNKFLAPIASKVSIAAVQVSKKEKIIQPSKYNAGQPLIYKSKTVDKIKRFGGLGVGINIAAVKYNGKNYKLLAITSIMNDSPAQKAGVKVGDYIVKIDGKSIEGIDLETAMQKLKGDPGTQIRITVLRKGESRLIDIVVTRALIQVIPAG